MKKILKKLGGTVLMALLFSLPSQGMEEGETSKTTSMIKKIGEGFSTPLPQRIISTETINGIIQDVINLEEPTPLKVEIASFFPPEIWIEIIKKMAHNSQLCFSQVSKHFNRCVFEGDSLLVPIKNLQEISDLEKILKAQSRKITKLIFSCPPQEKPFGTLFDLSLPRILKEWESSPLKNYPITAFDFSNTYLGIIIPNHLYWTDLERNEMRSNDIFSNLIRSEDGPFRHAVSLNFTNASLSVDNINQLIGSKNKLPHLKELILRYDNCLSTLNITKEVWMDCNLRKLDLTGRKLSLGTGLSLSGTPNNNPELKKMTFILEDFFIHKNSPRDVNDNFKRELKKEFLLLTWVRP